MRAYCFGSVQGSSCNPPERSLVRRKTCLLIAKHVYPRSELDTRETREDLLQEVSAQAWERFDHLLDRFRYSGRAQTWDNFERWLHVSMDRMLINAIRARRKQGPVVVDDIDDQAASADVGSDPPNRWLAQALSTLSPEERDLLDARVLNGDKPQALAARFGMSPEAVSQQLYRIKLKCRNETTRLIISDHLRRHRNLHESLRGVIEARCTDRHPCYMYRVECPKARSPLELAEKQSAGGEAQADQSLALLQRVAREALDSWGVSPLLDQCYWALR